MTEAEAINILQLNTPFVASKEANKAVEMAINALEKQIELRKNCEGSCSDCKYRGEFQCANDLLVDIEVRE